MEQAMLKKRRKTFRFLKLLERTQWFVGQYRENQISLYSANMAFSLLLSFFPFILLFFYVLKYTPYTEKDMIDFIQLIFPGKQFVTALNSWISEGYQNALENVYLSGSILGIIWSASRGFREITACLNRIYQVNVHRPIWSKFLLAIGYTLALAILLIVTIFVFIHGNQIIVLWQRAFPHQPTAIESLLLRFIIEFCASFIIFSLIYWAIPNKFLSMHTQIVGAGIASLAWLIFCYGFAYFADNIKDYTTVYGSMAYIIVFSLWLYICMQILFMGAIINQYLHLARTKQRRSKSLNKNTLKFLHWIFPKGQVH